jgi:hypothetical protein
MDILASYPQQTFIVIKIVVVIILFLYTIFSVVLVKQVRLMTQTVQVGLDKSIKTISVVHLAASVIILLFALVM